MLTVQVQYITMIGDIQDNNLNNCNILKQSKILRKGGYRTLYFI